MIEAPEALLLSEQINKTLKGKLITDVVTQFSPHKFAWFYKDPDNYQSIKKTYFKTDLHKIFIEITVL